MSETQLEEGIGTLAVGSVKTHNESESIVAILKRTGFSDNDISVIAPGDELTHDPKIALDHKAGSDPADEKPRDLPNKLKSAIVGAVTGGLVMGALGSLIGLASYAIPSLRFMITSPLSAALIYAAAGGAAGLAAGALIGMRVPDYNTKQHAIDVRASRTIVSVLTQSPAALQRAKKILIAEGAAEVHERIEPVSPH
jgi:hypothetical protein